MLAVSSLSFSTGDGDLVNGGDGVLLAGGDGVLLAGGDGVLINGGDGDLLTVGDLTTGEGGADGPCGELIGDKVSFPLSPATAGTALIPLHLFFAASFRGSGFCVT